jgi:peptidoglycan/LPS O-acetylase OafA/YrhL
MKERFYIPSLDGIRGLAVMLVFVSHCGLGQVVPGGLGVTIFFFLSGYLITSLLRVEYEQTSRIALRRFWVRRALRILPPMYIVLGLSIAAGAAGLVASDIRARAVVAQMLHLTNYYSIYTGERHLPPGTGILWSLAVEEHFYLIYPPLLALLLTKGTYRSAALWLTGLSLLVLGWRCVLVYGLDVSRGYTFAATDSRIDSILLGGVLGLWRNPRLDVHSRPSRRRVQWWVVAAFGVLVSTFFCRDTKLNESVRYTVRSLALFPVFFAAVRYHQSGPFRWLERPVFRWLGRLSYTIYLIHPLLIRVAERCFGNPWVVGLAAFAATIAFSVAMYALVERPLAASRSLLHEQPRSPEPEVFALEMSGG